MATISTSISIFRPTRCYEAVAAPILESEQFPLSPCSTNESLLEPTKANLEIVKRERLIPLRNCGMRKRVVLFVMCPGQMRYAARSRRLMTETHSRSERQTGLWLNMRNQTGSEEGVVVNEQRGLG